MRYRRQILIILLGLISLSGAACVSKSPRLEVKRAILDGILIQDNKIHPKIVREEYVIEPPDNLEILVLGHPDLSKPLVVVRPDGNITYDLIGKVPIGGMTVSEAEEFLEEKMREYVKEADVSIQVTSFASKNIYVMGRVASPGPQPFTGNNSVLDALSRAGLPTFGADIQKVLVVRQDKVNPRVIPVNFKQLAMRGISGEDLILKPNDVVLVTPNVFGRTEEVLNTILLPVGPITSPVFTLQSIDETFGLDLAGNDDGGGSAASDFAGTTAASTLSTTTTTATTTGP